MSSEEATHEGMDIARVHNAPSILALAHARECLREYVEGRAQLLHQKRNSGNIETTGSLCTCDTFFMNVGEFSNERQYKNCQG